MIERNGRVIRPHRVVDAILRRLSLFLWNAPVAPPLWGRVRGARHQLCCRRQLRLWSLLASKTRRLPKNGKTSVDTRPSLPQVCSPHIPLYSSAS
jgi:hypothetical protein